MPRKPSLGHETLQLGPLPVEDVNRTLGLELEAGDVVLTPGVNTHVLRRHPDDHPKCLPHIASVVANPLYAGDDFRNEGRFELIGRVPALGSPMLVAIEMARNADGNYEVRSFYPMREDKVQNRLRKGFLKPVRKH